MGSFKKPSASRSRFVYSVSLVLSGRKLNLWIPSEHWSIVNFSQNDLRWNGKKCKAKSFYKRCNELDYSSTPIPRKHPRNERVTSAEGLGTKSKNNLRGIPLGIRPIWRIHSHPIFFSFILQEGRLGKSFVSFLFSLHRYPPCNPRFKPGYEVVRNMPMYYLQLDHPRYLKTNTQFVVL